MEYTQQLIENAIDLLKKMIATPSISKEEEGTAKLIEEYFALQNIPFIKIGNNIIAKNKHYAVGKPTIVFNSHHDTVKPNPSYTKDPFKPTVEDGKLYGLGSNDAGGCLVSLIATFTHFYQYQNLAFNLILIASAEEEISGKGGVELVYQSEAFRNYTQFDINNTEHWCGIVGEPTLMQMAIAEKGLMVIDAKAIGKPGHAARAEGINALYIAVKDIATIEQHQFEKISPFLGPVKTTVTVIETETKQHNVVPAICNFVIDVRLNELYSPEEVLATLQSKVQSTLEARSMRLRSTSISEEHPLIKAGLKMGKTTYGSPTTSDKALTLFKTLKMGPGDSARSHTADEFIYIDEIKNGILDYIQLLEQCNF